MAREYAKAWFSMFTDDDFASQPHSDKWLYMTLLGQPALNYAGVQPINMRRWRKALRDDHGVPSEADIEKALIRMEHRGYVYTDDDTGEVLVRSFMRSDGIDRQPNVLKSGLRALAQIESPKLASVMLRELDRLTVPEVKNEKLGAEIDRLWSAARTHLEGLAEGFTEPFPKPFAEPFSEGLPEGIPRPGKTEPFTEPLAEGLPEGSVVVEVEVESPTEVVKKKPRNPKSAPKGAVKPKPIEQQTAEAVYESIGKAANFMGLRTIVKWAIRDRGSAPEAVEAACVAVHELGKPITKQTVDQCLDGKFGPIRVGDGPVVDGRDFIDYPGVQRDANGQLPRGFCER